MEYFDFLGFYYGENEIDFLLKEFSIKRVPILPRDDWEVHLSNKKMGVELIFSDAESLENPKRDYPDGALVLSTIFFYWGKGNKSLGFQGELPHGIKFGQKKSDVISLLGEPSWINFVEDLFWYYDDHKFSISFNKSGDVSLIVMELPGD